MSEENKQVDAVDPLVIGELITLPEAAKLSNLSERYLQAIAKKGRLKAKKSGGTWLTTEAAIEEYKRSRIRIMKKE
jgi:excisionase family DNA binding protein